MYYYGTATCTMCYCFSSKKSGEIEETGGRRGEETEEERSGSKSEGGSAQAGGGRGTKTAREGAAGDREG